MIHIGNKTTVQKVGKFSKSAILTKQFKLLGLKLGDEIYCFVEEIDGKKRIIVEVVK